MISLGVDPSLTGFGWCVHDSTKVGPARVVEKGTFKTSSKVVFVERYMSLRDHLLGVFDKYPQIEGVGVESPIFGESWSPGAYALFVMLNEAIYLRRKDVVYFDPGTVKLLAKMDNTVRRGKMHKSDMVDIARADTGIKGRFNNNEADAYHVAKFAAHFWELDRGVITQENLTPSELHTFLRIETYKRGPRAGQTAKLGALFKENNRFHRFSLLR